MEESDEELLKQWLMGDARAFEKFYHRHCGKVFGYARKKGIPKDDLSEIVQEVFLKLHLYIAQYEPQKKALPWFFTIVHNTCVDRLKRGGKVRQQWKAVSLDSLDFELSSELRVSSRNIRDSDQDVTEAIGILNSEQQRVLNMRVQEEMSFEDMGVATGKSSVALRKSYSRIIQSLREWFTKQEKK